MKKLTLVTLLILVSGLINAQTATRSLTLDDILKWNRITDTQLSNNGGHIVYKQEPWEGDPIIKISTGQAHENASYSGGTDAKITSDSKFVIFKLQAPVDSVRALKLKGTKKDDLPKDKLIIYDLEKGIADTITNLKTVKVPEKWAGWVVYQCEPDSMPKNDKKDKDKEEAFPLFVKNLNTGNVVEFPAVSSFEIAEEKEQLAFISAGDSTFEKGVYVYSLAKDENMKVLASGGEFKQLSLNKNGNKLAFLADSTDSKIKNYALYYWKGSGLAGIEVANSAKFLKDDWEISPNGKLTFSENDERLFFGTAPKKPEKDTTVLEEEIPVLDVWIWNEEILQTQQLNSKSRDEKKSYQAVLHLNSAKAVQLETELFTDIELIKKGDADQMLAISNRPYSVQTMWEGSPEHNDFYLVDVYSGEATLIKKDCRARPLVSPSGKYLFWYNASDTSWNTYAVATNIEYKITEPQNIQVADELNDIPNLPDSYRYAGWTENDEAFLVYDRYDIGKVNPLNKTNPIRLTLNGRTSRLSFRLVRFNNERNEAIKKDETLLLKAFNENSKADSYYSFNLEKPENQKLLFSQNVSLNTPLKAKDADLIVFTKEDFRTYPNLLATDLSFKNQVQISDAAPQQSEFNWGSAELVSWRSLDGLELEGTLHKPANFDPNKKYPMIVNFYEKSSNELLSYRMPENNRSTIDYHYYTSNGYLVFNPDIYYKEGYPGEDAFNCVMPGITALIAKGFVDEKHIGAQGHSWGGYQVAYLATRTHMFAAIESGAPVVNMFSAYGGIRWGSGMNRSFQYEHTQSRIGKSIWESPLRYLENSPLFTLDKIETPILIMHNDDDGAVPWYQGIEFFIGMRRLGKPAWLLNYNEADHWPLKVRDKHDFQIRLSQFFDHYLKNAPMPIWMSEGIPATKKGIELGYELDK